MYGGTPRVRRGWGPMGSEEMGIVLDSARWVNDVRGRVQMHEVEGPDLEQFLGLITASAPLGTAGSRWTYTVKRVMLKPATVVAPTAVTVDHPYAGDETAYNLVEWASTATAHGDGSDPSDLPAGLSLAPVAGVVWCRSWKCDDATSVWVFERANGVIGTCS